VTALRPYAVRVEELETPLALSLERRPQVTWRLAGPSAQAAARITVSGQATWWDSGWVEGGRGRLAIDTALSPSTRYDVRLQVRDADGTESTAGSWFETAPWSGTPASGLWIARDPTAAEAEFLDPPAEADRPNAVRLLDPAVLMRRTFALPAAPVRARLHASARGVYRAFVNGRRVGTDELAPGWTDYGSRTIYQTYDVTAALRAGVNSVGAELTDGWWSGFVGFDERRQGNHYGSAPELWMSLEAELPDGGTVVITTDDQWRQGRGAIEYSDLLMGEMVDARRSILDWAAADYDDSDWPRVRATGAPTTPFVPEAERPIRVTQRIQAIDRSQDAEGRWIYDFGQNLVGRVALSGLRLERGSQLVLRHGEALENGRLYIANLRTAQARDVYVAAGQTAETFEPAFALHGFRFVEITGLQHPLPLESVVASVIGNDLQEAGSITTSHPAIDSLISNVEWSLRGNFVGVPTDCPQRDERLGWLADAQVFLPTASYLREVGPFFRRWLWDVRNAQTPEGSFPDIAPVISHFFADGAPGWGDGGVIIPWELYRASGDLRILEDAFPSMAAWVGHIHRNNPDLIWRTRVGNHYGDWLQIDAETPREVLATAYFARSARLTAKAADALGRADSDRYAALANAIASKFCDAFVEDDGWVSGRTQTGQLLALAFDLLPAERRGAAAARLIDAIDSHAGLLTTGFLGVSLLCPVLSEIGRPDLAFRLLQETRFPSWLYSVERGATTIWERWDGWTDERGFQSTEMNSFNHYSLGSVGSWLFGYAAGIRQSPDSVAFDQLVIAPEVGGSISHVGAAFESPRGRVEVAWRIDSGRISLDVTVPPGPQALVRLPTIDAQVSGMDSIVCESGPRGTEVSLPPGTWKMTGTLLGERAIRAG
jgi:alpha-L-rhamnosidase